MSKKEDLKLVFDFIADFLREDTGDFIINDTTGEITIPVEEVKPKTKMESFIESINPENVKDIMERVEKFDNAPTFQDKPLLGDKERNFESTIRKLSEQVDKLTKERETNERNKLIDKHAEADFSLIKEHRRLFQEKLADEEVQGDVNNLSKELRDLLTRSRDCTFLTGMTGNFPK